MTLVPPWSGSSSPSTTRRFTLPRGGLANSASSCSGGIDLDRRSRDSLISGFSPSI